MSNEVELSVIICSVNPESALRTQKNILDTAGVSCEFIVVDNREKKWPIAKAYNFGASQARSRNLFFAHEDILFEQQDWARPVLDKLAEKSTGVIGFVGSRLRTGAFAPWSESDRTDVGRILYFDKGVKKELRCRGKHKHQFEPVIVVDGLGMFAAKRIWQEYPFDEENLTDFHCYDIDFCLTIAHHYTNYVYFGGDVNHLSNGSYNSKWAETTIRLTNTKWKELTPISTTPISKLKLARIKAKRDYSTLFTLIRHPETFPDELVNPVLRQFIQNSRKNFFYLRRLPVLLWQNKHKRGSFTGVSSQGK